ncbi:MAG TPA: gephyrin-like molybdotransferase Glp [Lacipirellulaceae bacterium]|jgi:molybdopterin molybdotransferase|nr:gephyrin-like molybdotransferase Glp [Lacipirellulaceae bacterium]
MHSVEEALDLVAEHCQPLAPQRVPLADAAGLLLADEITSDIDSPPYDKSMMDGYAVRSADREPERQVLEEIAAGSVPRIPLTLGAVSRIMTGAPIPEGADAVVPVEQSELVGNNVVRLLQTDPSPGQNVLPVGASMRAGDIVIQCGATIRPIEIAILAETGHAIVPVLPRPRLSILTTGNELVAVDQKPTAGQIRNSNGPMLVAAGTRAGAATTEIPTARDTHEDLTRCISQGLEADVLVLSGGVSAGKFDLVPQVLAELGVEQVFHKIALRPGKPLWFGAKKEGSRTVLVFGLPGNPVSSLVCFELFVRPAIAALSGRGFKQPSLSTARLAHDFDHSGGRAACLPARLEEDGPDQRVSLLLWQGSADLATLAKANALVRLTAERRQFRAGHLIEVQPI